VGCGGVERARGASPAEELYLQGVDALNDQDFLTATERFRVVKTKHVYTRYAALAELKLADVQFEQGRYLEAISLYELFMQGRPNHQKVPYAAWRVAEGYVKQRPSDFILNPPAHERDRGPSRDALRALNNYLERFPQGEHTKEAQEYRAACRTTLAEYELYVARFYRSREKLKASEGRYQALLNAFEDVPKLWREGAEELIALYQDSQRGEEAQALKARLKAFKESAQK
jgi:outer membrane protein assembly factor BamD